MSGVIMIFAKAPVAGEAKTRLIPLLGAEGAASMQAALLARTVAMATAQHDFPVELWCAPDAVHPLFLSCRDEYGVTLCSQQGGDLGARMAHAFNATLARHDWALVIGTDCPHLTTTMLQQSGEWLSSGTAAVLGPAADGGYYLLGLRRAWPALFSGIPWGSSDVLAETRHRLQEGGIPHTELPELHDLDRPGDLVHFPDLKQEFGVMT